MLLVRAILVVDTTPAMATGQEGTSYRLDEIVSMLNRVLLVGTQQTEVRDLRGVVVTSVVSVLRGYLLVNSPMVNFGQVLLIEEENENLAATKL